MTRAAAVLLVLATATASMTPAAAEPPPHNHLAGGCRFVAATSGGTTYDGVLHAEAVAYAVWGRRDPVTMTRLTCELVVNGSVAASVDGVTAGPAGVVPPRPFSYTAADTDTVVLCTTVDLVDAAGEAGTIVDCGIRTTEWQVVPHPVDEALRHVVWPAVDPVVCDTFLTLAPYLPPPLSVGPDGDLYVLGEPWWDCGAAG